MHSYDSNEVDIKFPPLIEQYERKIYDLRQLIEISKGLNSTLDYNILIDSILLTCMGQLQLLNAGIFLIKSIDGDKFTLHRNYKGFELSHEIEYSISFLSPVIKYIEIESRCFTLNEISANIQDDAVGVLEVLEPELIVPLLSKGELNGIIVLGDRINKSIFSESEIEYVLNIASLASIAIHNAMLYEMATTDMMTKLKIHHYFQTILIEEINRSLKYNRPLSLIMADIDHFKLFNDEHGHQAGDEVLKKVASIFKENIRLIDIAARYGGEEFAIILPKTDIHEAIIVAERIRFCVEQMNLDYCGKTLKVTLSMGITQYDASIDTQKEKLIERADKALYNSKREGRNKVSYF